ncbi:LacI family DNA-binding transcriptional regulator [Sinosporangium siamense]|uniref:LacI family transcriptional regulator n=1 Tax=Sinosporangium siamense TaxID=1367973 RepID=A0A919V5I4_9ACTN|nr:LacI family DNA-binding transcriptional regulator [Sinosporangium siamense]GII91578.1 LacI family transcriptional regulator [Sinosporangium siamense]
MSERNWRRPRQADIAKEAGVSQATVSYVISGRTDGPEIPEGTRARVLAAARRLGYVVNPVARNLAGGSTRLIGVYTFESVFPLDHHDFYHPFLVGIEAAAEAHGYDLVLFTSATGADGRRSIYRDNVNRLALTDGCVLIGKNADRDELARLRDDGFPFTYVGRREVPGDPIGYSAADYASATAEVVDHLADLGHRRVAYLGSTTPGEYTADRDTGFWEAARRHDLDTGGLLRPVGPEGLTPADVADLYERGATAFVVHDAAEALRVVDILGTLGLRVPYDCSVAALNDPPDGTAGAAELTCFHIPRREMGVEAVNLLMERLRQGPGAQPATTTLKCTFVAGRTSGPAPESRRKGIGSR